MENFKYADRLCLFVVEKMSPLFNVPLMYRSILFPASIWPFEGLDTYLANILVTVDRSGRVDMLSHVNDPTRDCSVLVYCF